MPARGSEAAAGIEDQPAVAGDEIAKIDGGGADDTSGEPAIEPVVTPGDRQATVASAAAGERQSAGGEGVVVTAVAGEAAITAGDGVGLPPVAGEPAIAASGPAAPAAGVVAIAPGTALADDAPPILASAPVMAPPTPVLDAGGDAALQEVALELRAAAGEGQQLLAAAAGDGTAALANVIVDEQAKIDDVATAHALGVAARVRTARDRVRVAIAGAKGQITAAETSEQAALAAWRAQAAGQAQQEIATRRQRVRALGAARGEEAVQAADAAATSAGGRIEGRAEEARQRGEAAARAATGDRPEVVKAKAAAAREVAANTAAEITKTVEATQAQLRGLGPETKPQFDRHAGRFAEGLGRRLPGLTAELERTAAGAGGALQQSAAAGHGAVDACGVQVLAGLGALEQSVAGVLREQAATSKQALAEQGGQAAEALRAQHQAAAQAGADVVATIFASLPNRRMRRAAASTLGKQLRAHVAQGFATTEQQARAASAQIAVSFAEAAAHIHAALDETAAAAGAQADEGAAAATTELTASQERVVAQLLAAVTGARARGDTLVAATARSLDASVDDLDSRFGTAVGDLRAALAERTAEAVTKAREPLASLDVRMAKAMERAEDRLEQSWLERQFEDLVEGINWGFVAGLVVGLLVTIAVVALLGTGVGALILAGALAGAVSVAASTLTENAIQERETDWGKLGKDMVAGAVIGAVGGLVSGGVAGAVGGALQRQLVTEVGAVALAKAMNVAVGTTTGAIQNLVNGDPWDKGLLLNVMTNVAMTYGPGGRAIDLATQGARDAMVGSGHALNVTPQERAAAAPDPAFAGELATLQEPPRLEDRIDQVTGVEKGPAYDQAMQELRDFYANQEREAAATVKEVHSSRVEQTLDAAGNPEVLPDGSPAGYVIDGRFDARRFAYDDGHLTEITINVLLDPKPGVTPADLQRVQADTHAGVEHFYNGNRTLPNGDRLHVTVEFVTDPAQAHLTVDVEPGQGRANQRLWFVESAPATLAHELGHQLGLLDEYHDPDVVNRRDPASPGVTDDNSLMGSFWVRDATGAVIADPATVVHDRHLEQIAGDIDATPGPAGATGPAPPAPPIPHAAAASAAEALAHARRCEQLAQQALERAQQAGDDKAVSEAMRLREDFRTMHESIAADPAGYEGYDSWRQAASDDLRVLTEQYPEPEPTPEPIPEPEPSPDKLVLDEDVTVEPADFPVDPRPTKEPIPGLSGKEAATDVPDWIAGQRPRVGETPNQFALRLMRMRYPNRRTFDTGPRSEYSWAKKYARGFRDPQ